MTDMPPGLYQRSTFYIRVLNCSSHLEKVCWVARWRNSDRGWNISPGYADPFNSIQEAKKVMRSLAKGPRGVGAAFSIVEVVMAPTAKLAYPLEVLDRLARIG